MSEQLSVRRRPFVLVHGAWHGAWCWSSVAAKLIEAGHPVVTIDLPGHGLRAAFPASYDACPRTAAFATEASAVAGVTLNDYSAAIADAVGLLSRSGHPPVLVGHSMGGVAIQAGGEALGPDKVAALVYVCAFMPAGGRPLISYVQDPTAAESQVFGLLQADPQMVGALRLDPRSSDTAYGDRLTSTFYGDVEASTARAARNLLTPDAPIQPFVTPLALTPARWGAIPRIYVRTAFDRAVVPAMQDLMIAEADGSEGMNRTTVVRLESAHSPFFSMPDRLVEVLLGAA